MRSSVHIAVVGLGRIGALHARNVAHLAQGCDLCWVVDAHAERASRLGRELDVPWSRSLDDALRDPAVDGVIVATPTPTHPTIAETAVRHGKHVLCEKPIALELDETRRVIRSAARAGAHLQVGFQRRFEADLVDLRAAIVGGRLGVVRSVRTTHRNPRMPDAFDPVALGGLLTDVAIHDFDVVRWLVGDIAEVATVATDGNGDPAYDEAAAVHAVTILRLASGAIGTVETSREARYGFDASIEVLGSEATVRVGVQRRASYVDWLERGRASQPLVMDHADWHAEAYVREVEHFASAIRCGERPAVTGEDAAAAFSTAMAAAQSLAERRPIAVARTAIAIDDVA